MPAIRHDIKRDVSQYGKTIADLARDSDLDYRRLSGALNGYWYLKPEDESAIRRVFSEWRNQILQTIAA